MAVSKTIRNGRPSTFWTVTAKNFLDSSGKKHGSWSRSFPNETEARRAAALLVNSSQVVVLTGGWNNTKEILTKNESKAVKKT